VEQVVAPILPGTTDVLANGGVASAQQVMAAILAWAIMAAHSLDLQVNATATVLELCLQQHHLLARTHLITFMNVGYVADVGQFHMAMVHWVL
jgi:hypothetical protein